MKAAGQSVVGMRRANNQDAIYLSEPDFPVENLFLVADGMGGCNAGEVASGTAIASFLENIRVRYSEEEPLDLLVGALASCNKAVYNQAKDAQELSGMGTTFLAALIVEERLYVAYVGDSRAYMHRAQKLTQLTTDHSYVMELVRLGNITLEEANTHPKRNIITRAVGTQEVVEIDTVIETLMPNDRILLCSDGLSTMLNNEEIGAILEEELTTAQKVQRLIDLANEKGGYDNISLILIEG